MIMRSFSYLTILSILLCISCKDDINSPEEVLRFTVNSSDQLLPAKVGNSWTYIDSLKQNNELKISTRQTIIESEEIFDGKKWYTVNGLNIGMMSFSKFYLVDNNICIRMVARGPNMYVDGVKIIPALEFGINYRMILGGDDGGISVYARHIKSSYAVGKYIFNEYFEYTFSGGLEVYRVVIVPGVGVVDYFEVGQEYTGRKGYTLRSSIKSFSLK